MRIEYELTPGDWAEFGEYVATHASAMRKVVREGQQSGTIAVLLVFGALSWALKSWFPLVVGAVLAALWLWHWPRQIVRKSRESMLARDLLCLKGRHVLEALPEGLRSHCDVSDITTRWAGIHAIAETPSHVFVMLSEVQGYTIPRAGIVSGDLEELVRLVRRELKP